MREFTYPDVGATRDGPLPSGYHHGRVRERIGTGRAAFSAATNGLMTWKVQRGAGVRVDSESERAADGVEVTNRLGIGRFRISAPCRVVWTVEEENRVGFAYGTLPGHPASGEESLIIELDEDHHVWFTISVFSRPAAWYAKLGGPVARAVQAATVRRYVKAAQRLAHSH